MPKPSSGRRTIQLNKTDVTPSFDDKNSAKKTLRSQKSLTSTRSKSGSKAAPAKKEKEKKVGLSQKQKDDRKRASQAYRDRQKKLHEQNFSKLDIFKARFEAFSSFIAEVCDEGQKGQICQKMEHFDLSNQKPSGSSGPKVNPKNRISRKNSLTGQKGFVKTTKTFVGLD
mgnify:CR=1 FL=1